jgi:hypothetical protein
MIKTYLPPGQARWGLSNVQKIGINTWASPMEIKQCSKDKAWILL